MAGLITKQQVDNVALAVKERRQLDASEKALRIIAMVKVCGKNWCNPAYADGKLYLRDAKELLCVQLLKPSAD